jgi:hypothetical protein
MDYTCLREVIRGHFHANNIADDEADEALAHFAGDVSKHFMTVAHFYFEHRACKHSRHSAFDFYSFFFSTFDSFAYPGSRIGSRADWTWTAVSRGAITARFGKVTHDYHYERDLLPVINKSFVEAIDLVDGEFWQF